MSPSTNTFNPTPFAPYCPPRAGSETMLDTIDADAYSSDVVSTLYRTTDPGPSMRHWLTRLAAQDPDASCHAMRVACLADRVAIQMGHEHRTDHQARRTLFVAGMLHDVGKLRIPLALLNKPGPLTLDERTLVRTHSVIGEGMLQHDPYLRHVAPIVRSHHERWDGGGYPDGLRAEQIPWQARVIAVCDTVSAMNSDRSYRAALPMSFVIDEIRLCAGTQFDPRVADAAVRVLQATSNAQPRWSR